MYGTYETLRFTIFGEHAPDGIGVYRICLSVDNTNLLTCAVDRSDTVQSICRPKIRWTAISVILLFMTINRVEPAVKRLDRHPLLHE